VAHLGASIFRRDHGGMMPPIQRWLVSARRASVAEPGLRSL
jgi:hypothetical protein